MAIGPFSLSSSLIDVSLMYPCGGAATIAAPLLYSPFLFGILTAHS